MPPGKKILIIDDSPTELRLTAAPLEALGYQVVTAHDGETGVEVAERERPDLILLDIVLPRKNGFQVCRHLKLGPDTKHIKIVLVSSKRQESDRFWGLKQGADEYVCKPFEEATLLAAVQRLLV